MDEKYDCTKDVTEHIKLVYDFLLGFSDQLVDRALNHDRSKLEDPVEKELFDRWTPKLREQVFGSDEYKRSLEGMGEGVARHYQANRHHPEHWGAGIRGMTLVDILEMVADWMAAAKKKGVHVDLDHAVERFGISDQLAQIIANTITEWELESS